MPFIWFNSQKAYSQLCYHGHVMTLRKKQKKDGMYILRTSLKEPYVHDGDKIEVMFVQIISSPDELNFYVGSSGFESVQEWLDEAKRLNPSKKINEPILPLYLHSARLPMPEIKGDEKHEQKKEST